MLQPKIRKAVVQGAGTGTVIEEIAGLLLVQFEFTKIGPCLRWVDPRKEVVCFA